MVIATSLANIASLKCNRATAAAWTLVPQAVSFLHTSSEETLNIDTANNLLIISTKVNEVNIGGDYEIGRYVHVSVVRSFLLCT